MKRMCNTLAAALALIFTSCQTPTQMSEAAVEPLYFEIQAPEPEIISYNVPLEADLQSCTLQTCQRFGISQPEMIFGLMEHESDFDPSAISETGDIGLMQINPVNLDELSQALGTKDLLDPYQNIEAGVYIISQLWQKYESWPMTFMAYNLGEAGAMEYWQAGIYETDYSIAVMDKASRIEVVYA